MTRQDEIALKAVRASTLKSLNVKRKSRIAQIKEDAEKKIQEVNIQYSQDPERLRAKYAADEYARSEKARKKAEKNIAREKALIEKKNKIRKFSLAEEIFSSVVQGFGACVFIAITAILDVLAYEKIKGEPFANFYLLCYSLFGGTMILMYIMSTLHHALRPEGAKEVFNRLSHIFTYLVIGFAYSSYTFRTLSNDWNILGIVIFAIVWALCFTGIIMNAILGSRNELVNIIFCLVIGWLGIILVNQLYEVLSTRSFSLLILSGVVYSAGLVFYRLRSVKFMRGIGNLVFLFGGILLFFSLFFINDLKILN